MESKLNKVNNELVSPLEKKEPDFGRTNASPTTATIA
jgi:hypothetical protein